MYELTIPNIHFSLFFPRVGVVFCGRQSPGGHNAIWGLHDAIKVHNPKSTLLGFLGEAFNLFDYGVSVKCFVLDNWSLVYFVKMVIVINTLFCLVTI